jgi:hypothetical protein
MNDVIEERLVRAFAAELEQARRDLRARPLGVTQPRPHRRRLPLGVAAALTLVLVALGFATVDRPWATVGPSSSVAPGEPTYDQIEAARWVTGYLKYLYQLTLYPPGAGSPSPDFLFTKRGLAEAVAQDDLLRRGIARQVSVGLEYVLGSVCVLRSDSAGVEMDITLELEHRVLVQDASLSTTIQTLAPGPRHLRIVIVRDAATGHWVIDHWQGSPFETPPHDATNAPSATDAGARCS